jgi:antitoxin (DNA-binding transcriptional repressor) of toxin-antitoxin stability system
MHQAGWRVLRTLIAITGTCALAAIGNIGASAFTLTEFHFLAITKDCGGLTGTGFSLALTLERSSQTQGFATVSIDCGQTKIVPGVSGIEGGSVPFEAGDVVTITETNRPVIAILPAASTTVTITAASASPSASASSSSTTTALTIHDPAAVSIHKSCAEGVSGTAGFTVTNTDSNDNPVSVQVACGATKPVQLPSGWKSTEVLNIHESTPPTNGVAAEDQGVAIPGDEGSPAVKTFTNAFAASSASPSASPTPVPSVPVLAQTGTGSTPSPSPWPLAVGGSLVVLLIGLLWLGRLQLRRKGKH